MKKFILSILLVSGLSTGLFAATLEVGAPVNNTFTDVEASATQDVTKVNYWGTMSLMTKVHENVAILFKMGSRTNISFDSKLTGSAVLPAALGGGTKEVNVDDTESPRNWVNEFFIGPTFIFKPLNNVVVTAGAQYRPMFIYLFEQKESDGDRFTRHTLWMPLTFVYRLGFMDVAYKARFWYRPGVEHTLSDGTVEKIEWDFLMRNLISFRVPIPWVKGLSFGGQYGLSFDLTQNEVPVSTDFKVGAFDATITVIGKRPLVAAHLAGAGFSYRLTKWLELELGYGLHYRRGYVGDEFEKTTINHYIATNIKFRYSFLNKQ